MIEETPPPIPSIKGKSLAEAHKERMAAKPDVWTLNWWQSRFDEVVKQLRGMSHSFNLAVANMLDYSERVTALEARLQSVEEDNRSLTAKAGELQADLTIALKRIDDMSNWAKKFGKGKGDESPPAK